MEHGLSSSASQGIGSMEKSLHGPKSQAKFFTGLTSSLATGHAASSTRAPDNYLWLVADLINIYSVLVIGDIVGTVVVGVHISSAEGIVSLKRMESIPANRLR
ncbi:hypothetical protein VTN00DRAFT_857 [Thermoascus crustaceus]|uniref:uncharacterized protein n=1 Tax=Thermoascus crustaceus TaxID=5088 RepID=UPI00374483B0